MSPSRAVRSFPARAGVAWLGEFAGEMRDALDKMEQAVADCYLDAEPTELEGSAQPTSAWGVWVRPPRVEEGALREGQHGVLGTSAGLELLASSREYRGGDDDRRRLVYESWLYLRSKFADKPVISADGEGPSAPKKDIPDEPDYRRNLVVRQSQLLRALSSIEHRARLLVREDERLGSLEDNNDFAKEVLEDMQACRVTNLSIADLPDLRELQSGPGPISGYCYSSDDPEALPETSLEWAYLLATVLVGVTRAYEALFVAPEEFAEYVTSQDIARLAEWTTRVVKNSKTEADQFRVGLFAGWALLVFDNLFRTTPTSALGDLHGGGNSPLLRYRAHDALPRLKASERKKLHAALADGAQEVIEHPSLRGDLHHPYSFHVKVTTGGPDLYRQDHLVVPTVPIVLWLKARLDPRALFDYRVEKLARSVAEAFDQPDRPKVAPAQSNTYNGTVNVTYFHQAVNELHEHVDRITNRTRGWRWRAALRRPRPYVSNLFDSPKTALVYATFLLFLGPPTAVLLAKVGLDLDDDDPPQARREAPVRVILGPRPKSGEQRQVIKLSNGETTVLRVEAPPPKSKSRRRP